MISKYTGKPIHHKDCTYCDFRVVFKHELKKKKVRELEKCGVSGAIIPPPGGDRYCSEYTQRTCDCEQCEILRDKYGKSLLREMPKGEVFGSKANYSKGAKGVQRNKREPEPELQTILPNTDGFLF